MKKESVEIFQCLISSHKILEIWTSRFSAILKVENLDNPDKIWTVGRYAPGIIITDVSDHLPVFVTTDLKVYRDTNNTVKTEIRKLNDINMQTFKSELSKFNWEHVLEMMLTKYMNISLVNSIQIQYKFMINVVQNQQKG